MISPRQSYWLAEIIENRLMWRSGSPLRYLNYRICHRHQIIAIFYIESISV